MGFLRQYLQLLPSWPRKKLKITSLYQRNGWISHASLFLGTPQLLITVPQALSFPTSTT